MSVRLEHLRADIFDPSPLARAALSGQLPRHLLRVPRTLAELEAPAERFEPDDREEIATALESHLALQAPHVAVLDQIRALRQPGSLCVVTGQQPGFLAAPLYNVWKALHAIRLARELTQQLGRPVVPIFWNHADDHDVAEVHHAHLLNVNLDIQKVGLAGMSSGRLPLSRVIFEEDKHRLGAVRAAIEELVHGQPYASEALDMCMPRAGESFASAFTRTLTTLLGPLGLVVLEPDWLRPRFSRVLAGLVLSDPLDELQRGTEALNTAGFPTAIDPHNAALVFHHEDKGRRALRCQRDANGKAEWRYDGEDGSRTSSELAAEIVQAPLDWSAGALLRPLVQDLALPCIAYIGGHGELAYHAQLGAVRAALDLPRTHFVPRLSCTVVDPQTRLALHKLGVSTAEILAAKGAWGVPEDITETPEVFARLRAVALEAERALDGCRDDVSLLDKGLAVHLKRLGDQLRKNVEEIVVKAERVQLNKSGKGRRHERRVNNALVPRAVPQERLLGPLQTLARFGTDWLTEFSHEIDPLPSTHVVLHLGPDATDDSPARSDA